MAELTENLLKLRFASGVGNLLLWRLLTHFGGSDKLLGAPASLIAAVEGMTAAKAEAILEAANFDPRPEMEKALNAGVNIIPYDDPEYPKPLIYTFDPPAVLYVLGRLTQQDQIALGMVGTRHASRYGREQAQLLSGAAARAGYTVVSGLARGIDTCAHIGALDAGGRTVGVLGCGFDHMYPEENRDLALEISACGAVISELPMATQPSRTTFPARNRIIAGMALGLVVIEAPLRSGSLITARLANEIGRSVFAVPGRVGDAASAGCNKLIKDGAVIVNSADDIFEELNPQLPLRQPQPKKTPGKKDRSGEGSLFPPQTSHPNPSSSRIAVSERAQARNSGKKTEPDTANRTTARGKSIAMLTDEQKQVFDTLTADWSTIDDISASSGLASGKTASILALLKMKRLVEQGPGQTYHKEG